jgi:hypothetical protein
MYLLPCNAVSALDLTCPCCSLKLASARISVVIKRGQTFLRDQTLSLYEAVKHRVRHRRFLIALRCRCYDAPCFTYVMMQVAKLQSKGWVVLDVRLDANYNFSHISGSESAPLYRYVQGDTAFDNLKRLAMASFAMKATGSFYLFDIQVSKVLSHWPLPFKHSSAVVWTVAQGKVIVL